MAYLLTRKIEFPLEIYKVNSYKFHQNCTYNGINWGIHLGEDINRSAGAKVKCIGRGKVVYSALHAGRKEKPNWGNIIIVAHKNPKTKNAFFSLYGHLGKRLVEKSERVEMGQIIGTIGKAKTPENGWWEEEHLHFAIYTGPWKGRVLPGYWEKGNKRTKLSYWQNPTEFIKKCYN